MHCRVPGGPLAIAAQPVTLPNLGNHWAAMRQQGFSLIEIMVVVVIIGILATVVVLNIADAPDEARVAKARQTIASLEAGLELYRLNNHHYPSTEQGLEALVRKPAGQPEPRNWKAGGYIKSLPLDPWQREYQYLNPGVNGAVDIWSWGADGQPGGEGANADIGNWTQP